MIAGEDKHATAIFGAAKLASIEAVDLVAAGAEVTTTSGAAFMAAAPVAKTKVAAEGG